MLAPLGLAMPVTAGRSSSTSACSASAPTGGDSAWIDRSRVAYTPPRSVSNDKHHGHEQFELKLLVGAAHEVDLAHHEDALVDILGLDHGLHQLR